MIGSGVDSANEVTVGFKQKASGCVFICLTSTVEITNLSFVNSRTNSLSFYSLYHWRSNKTCLFGLSSFLSFFYLDISRAKGSSRYFMYVLAARPDFAWVLEL